MSPSRDFTSRNDQSKISSLRAAQGAGGGNNEFQILKKSERDTGVETRSRLVGRAEQTLVPIQQRLSKEHREQRPEHKERSEGNILIAFHELQRDQADAYD